jgi:TatD DNase family protein
VSGLGALVDTHCHLAQIEDRGYLEPALAAAAAAGVEQIVTVGLNLEDSERNRQLAERLPGVFFSVGWHPHETAPPDPRQLHALGELLDHPRAVAVGEIGLDQFWRPGYHETPLDIQQRSMRAMLELAADRALPVIVHDRDAHPEVLAELARHPGVSALMHCFSGDGAMARSCAQRGHLLSFSGTVTYKGSHGIRDAARMVANDGYVLETDAPFLAPQVHRGKPNQPAYITDTSVVVAEVRATTPTAVRSQSTTTARRFFALPADDLLTWPA